MNTDKIWQIVSTSSEQTEQLGAHIGSRLRGGEVLELVSDLGGGKTTFTKGLVRGAGSSDKVASPTFTISKQYNTDKYSIEHFDFYRLGEAGIVGDELSELIGDRSKVLVVEWAEVVHGVLPAERLVIDIKMQADGSRQMSLKYPADLKYLLEGLV